MAQKKKKSFGKGKTTNNRGRSSVDEKRYKSDSRPANSEKYDKVDTDRGNDISWYQGLSQLTSDTSTFYFSHALREGAHFVSPTGVETPNNWEQDYFYTPGIARVKFVTTPGDASSAVDPVTIAARKLYSDLRKTNSGSRNYDAPDLMMYLLTMDSIYCYWAHLVRIYGVARAYSAGNRYYPDKILEVLGVDPDSVTDELVKLRTYINEYTNKINLYCVPSKMPIFKTHMWYHSGLFMDRPSDQKAQTYVFVPECFYQFAPIFSQATDSEPYVYMERTNSALAGGHLDPVILPQGASVDELISFGNRLLEPIFGDQDFDTISGDMLKCYGPEVMWRFAPITAEAMILPTYDENILKRIHNMRLCPIDMEDDFNGIYQDNKGVIVYNPKFIGDRTTSYSNVLFNCDEVDPSPAQMMYYSRLNVSVPTSAMDKGGRWPSVIPTSLTVYGLGDYSTTHAVSSTIIRVEKLTRSGYAATSDIQQAGILPDDLMVSTAGMQFNYFPLMVMEVPIYADSNNAKFNKYMPLGDIKNFTVLSEGDIRRMHRVATLNEFAIPDLVVG